MRLIFWNPCLLSSRFERQCGKVDMILLSIISHFIHLHNGIHQSPQNDFTVHDDKLFPRYWPFVRGIHRSPVNPPHQGQWRGALMFLLILSKQSRRRRFETSSCSLWRHCDAGCWFKHYEGIITKSTWSIYIYIYLYIYRRHLITPKQFLPLKSYLLAVDRPFRGAISNQHVMLSQKIKAGSLFQT